MVKIMLIVLSAIQVMSYNVRVSTAPDGENDWEIRKPASVMMILDRKPDVVGLQEAMEDQVLYLKDELSSDYEVIGVNHENGPVKGEHMTIMYRKATVICHKWGTFWLSETPDRASKGWDGAYERSATWALMQDRRSGSLFFVVNTHLDHIGDQARSKGLALIEHMLKEINPAEYPVALTGDFNCTADYPALEGIRSSMNNSRETALHSDDVDSYNAWGGEGSGKIDFVWYTGFTACKRFETVTRQYGKYPFVSDHYPIVAKLIF